MSWLRTPKSELYTLFESLGNNCEFGIVQRIASVDPPGLFRNVGFLGIGQIINAVSSGLAGMFDDGNYSYERRRSWPDYSITCHRFGFDFHAALSVALAKDSPEWNAEAAKNVSLFRFLKRKLLEDMATGDKIFVFRTTSPVADHEVVALHRAIRKHGPGWLLLVGQEPSYPDARIELIDDGLIRASMPKLSNENPPIIDLPGWDKILRNALALRFGDSGLPPSWRSPGTDTFMVDQPPPPQSDAVVLEHRFLQDVTPRAAPFHYRVPDRAKAETYMVSAWVNIPADADISDLGLAILGRRSERLAKADVTLRDRWQHVSVISHVDDKEDRIIVPFLGAAAKAHSKLYTAAWVFGRLQPLGDSIVSKPLPSLQPTPAAAAPSVGRATPGTGALPAPALLSYKFNNGGLNNQKLILFGLFHKAKATAADIILPGICLFDQGEDMQRKRGAAVPFRHVPLETFFTLEPLRRFAARHGIGIRDGSPAESLGWEFFGGGGAIPRAQAAGELDGDHFACDFFRNLVSCARECPEIDVILGQLRSRGIGVVAQCRIEADWQHHMAQHLNVVAAGEDHVPTITGIMAKVRESLPAKIVDSGVFVLSDEAWLPEGKERLREAVQGELGIRLYWKSDFLSPTALARPPIFLSMLDFEVGVHADYFVGSTRSTFANLITFERFARTRRHVDTHYIYNAPGLRLMKRTDNGAFHWAEGASRAMELDTAGAATS